MAKLSDWIVGTAPAPNEGRLVFVMRVDRTLTFDAYFNDPAYASKKSGPENPYGDNIYEPIADRRGFRQLPNPAHDERSKDRDLSTNRVLISNTFYYFGGKGPRIPEQFKALVHSTQGHLRVRADRDDPRYPPFIEFLAWIQQYPMGVTGKPTDIEVICVFPDDDDDG